MVTYSKYWVDELGFTIEIKSAPDSYLAEQNGYVRIRSVDATWELQKLTNDTTLVEYKAFADPRRSIAKLADQQTLKRKCMGDI